MQNNIQFFESDTFARDTGIVLISTSPGKARVKMEIFDKHLNSHRTVHGGAIFTLADTAFALASNSHGVPAAAINAHISYMKSVSSGTLFADAEEFGLNPKLATYTVRVIDGNGDNIAIFQGMVYRKTQRK
jgi:acyl-CoA thioesterase